MLNKHNKNFIDELDYSTFGLADILQYFQDPSWSDVIKSTKQLNTDDNIKGLLRTMVKRNITVKVGEDEYAFTKAHKLFTEFARELMQRENTDQYINLTNDE